MESNMPMPTLTPPLMLAVDPNGYSALCYFDEFNRPVFTGANCLMLGVAACKDASGIDFSPYYLIFFYEYRADGSERTLCIHVEKSTFQPILDTNFNLVAFEEVETPKIFGTFMPTGYYPVFIVPTIDRPRNFAKSVFEPSVTELEQDWASYYRYCLNELIKHSFVPLLISAPPSGSKGNFAEPVAIYNSQFIEGKAEFIRSSLRERTHLLQTFSSHLLPTTKQPQVTRANDKAPVVPQDHVPAKSVIEQQKKDNLPPVTTKQTAVAAAKDNAPLVFSKKPLTMPSMINSPNKAKTIAKPPTIKDVEKENKKQFDRVHDFYNAENFISEIKSICLRDRDFGRKSKEYVKELGFKIVLQSLQETTVTESDNPSFKIFMQNLVQRLIELCRIPINKNYINHNNLTWLHAIISNEGRCEITEDQLDQLLKLNQYLISKQTPVAASSNTQDVKKQTTEIQKSTPAPASSNDVKKQTTEIQKITLTSDIKGDISKTSQKAPTLVTKKSSSNKRNKHKNASPILTEEDDDAYLEGIIEETKALSSATSSTAPSSFTTDVFNLLAKDDICKLTKELMLTPSLSELKNPNGQTLLMLALQSDDGLGGYDKFITTLLEISGKSICAKDTDQKTTLHYWAERAIRLKGFDKKTSHFKLLWLKFNENLSPAVFSSLKDKDFDNLNTAQFLSDINGATFLHTLLSNDQNVDVFNYVISLRTKELLQSLFAPLLIIKNNRGFNVFLLIQFICLNSHDLATDESKSKRLRDNHLKMHIQAQKIALIIMDCYSEMVLEFNSNIIIKSKIRPPNNFIDLFNIDNEFNMIAMLLSRVNIDALDGDANKIILGIIISFAEAHKSKFMLKGGKLCYFAIKHAPTLETLISAQDTPERAEHLFTAYKVLFGKIDLNKMAIVVGDMTMSYISHGTHTFNNAPASFEKLNKFIFMYTRELNDDDNDLFIDTIISDIISKLIFYTSFNINKEFSSMLDTENGASLYTNDFMALFSRLLDAKRTQGTSIGIFRAILESLYYHAQVNITKSKFTINPKMLDMISRKYILLLSELFIFDDSLIDALLSEYPQFQRQFKDSPCMLNKFLPDLERFLIGKKQIDNEPSSFTPPRLIAS